MPAGAWPHAMCLMSGGLYRQPVRGGAELQRGAACSQTLLQRGLAAGRQHRAAGPGTAAANGRTVLESRPAQTKADYVSNNEQIHLTAAAKIWRFQFKVIFHFN